MIYRFEKLQVWQLAHELVLGVYRATKTFPPAERFELTAQIRRAAAAIPTNLSEGGARGHRREYLQFCYIARGSGAELRYLLRLALDLGYLSSSEADSLNRQVENVMRMLNGLIRSLRRNQYADERAVSKP